MEKVLSSLHVLEDFKSRKNKVQLCLYNNKKVVLKKHSNIKYKQNESEALNKFSMTGYAPTLIENGSDYIICEYLEGELLHDKFQELLFKEKIDEIIKLAHSLSIFLQMYHTVTNKILFDVNFRNFVYQDGRIYCIDYELTQNGLYNLDIAGIIVHSILIGRNHINELKFFIDEIMKNFRLTYLDVVNDIKQYTIMYNEINDLKIDFTYVQNIFINMCRNN